MRLLLLFLLGFGTLTVPAQSQKGIEFRDYTFEEALSAAQKENKLIFLDCYTAWCSPCKKMAAEVFTQPEAGAYFNDRFVNIKLDMGTDAGKKLAADLKINAYPTLFLIRSDGTIQHAWVGGGLPELLRRMEYLQDEKKSLYYLSGCYKRGELTKAEMMDYLDALVAANYRDDAIEVAAGLFRGLSETEKLEACYWPVYAISWISPLESENFKRFIAHVDVFRQRISQSEVDGKL